MAGMTAHEKARAILSGATLADYATADAIALAFFVHGTFDQSGHAVGDYVPAPFHHRLARIVEAIDRGEITRAAISCPPQHGKSTHTTQLGPLFHIGRAEAEGRRIRVGIACYAASLARGMSQYMRDVVETGRLAPVFPGLRVRRDSRSATDWTTEGGSTVRAVGVGGGFTGKPFDFIYIDDPYKNIDDGTSELYRARVDRWYRTTVRPRLQDAGRLVLIQTRWHSQDLAGTLLAESETGGRDVFRAFVLPALIDEGKPTERPLWPERYSHAYLLKTRAVSGVRHWSTIYQQVPVDQAPGETLPEPARIDKTPAGLVVYGYVDPAHDGRDRSAWCFGGVDGEGRAVIVGAESERANAVSLAPRIAADAARFAAGVVYVEDNSDKGYTADALRAAGVQVRRITNTKNKLGRIHAHVRTQWGRIVFGPDASPDFLRRLAAWTELSPHDDEPDALAGLVERLAKRRDVSYIDL